MVMPSPAHRSAHVLVVDDEPAIAERVAAIVTGIGHRVTTCHTWTEALRAFGKESIKC